MEKKKTAEGEAGRGGDEAAVSADLCALRLADNADEGAGAEEQAKAGQEVADDDDVSSLFDEPPPRPDCDICMLSLPIQAGFQSYLACCGKTICTGCVYAQTTTILKTNKKRIEKAKKEQLPPPPLLEHTCPYCRIEVPFGEGCEQESLGLLQKRVETGDPLAVAQMAFSYRDGDFGLSPDRRKFLELIHQAASLGSANAHHEVGKLYGSWGLGVKRNLSTSRAHYEAAAKSGHANARHALGEIEYAYGNKKTAVRHWRISAAAGYKPSVDELIKCFAQGLLSKESLEESMRAKHEACQAMRSEDRDREIRRCPMIAAFGAALR